MLIHAPGPLYLPFLCWIVLSQCLEGLIPCGHSGLITSSESPSLSIFSKVGSSWSFSIRSKVKVAQLCPTLCSPLLYISPWKSAGQDTGVGSLSLLQGIFPTQGSIPGLPHCKQILYQLSHREALSIREPCEIFF